MVMFFPIIGFQMMTANFFQSIGMASKAIFLSLTRQMIILVPCLLILLDTSGSWRMLQYAGGKYLCLFNCTCNAELAIP